MITKRSKSVARKKRHAHVRRTITGTPERPRLNVFRSSKHIYAQLIDDVNGVTLASASTLDSEVAADATKKDAAKAVGELVAKRAIENGHKVVVFDRGGYVYHGRVATLADAAREAGLQF
ncbi:50S ribosomal protein L18 [Halalkalibacter krulwichiae]|uniref:Large ribosomal subunit protein uL18 n=1 Tax=Halalkalibacter krulwichiae TaxID=199441 RepID=A0A1X9M7D9_9BACI|nr:50S ribosomal protein L18 [Halalkalibacter krulwichiae]ARK28530.1 50S ribosomal protein L18 [Halalkalibacter krulwichiae]